LTAVAGHDHGARARAQWPTWSAATEATFTTTQDFTKLKVTEIAYNPPDAGAVNGSELEFAELKNIAPSRST
jgi:hypothetical protein